MSVCKVHNIGFYKLEPKSICCMSCEDVHKKLAVSRSDASVEIWNIRYSPFVEKTIPGPPNGSVEALAWCDLRLFSTGLNGFLTEYNLFNLRSKYSIPVTSGAAWCMDINRAKTHLAVATEIGFINIFAITNEGVTYEKLLDKQEGRILCIKYDATGTRLVTGSCDTLRVWNVETGHAIHKLTTGRVEALKETIVWSLTVTNDFTIISGDSRGKIAFWDGEMGTQIESYLSHNADILSICLSEDQKTLYCAGVDPIIMSFAKVQLKGNNSKWVKSIQRKIHDHDVRSLLLCDKKLYSGGVDGYLAVSSYPPKTLLKYPPLLQNPVVSVCPKIRLVMLRYATYLEVWRLGVDGCTNNSGDEIQNGLLPIQSSPMKMLVLKSKNDEFILCATISNDGQYIIYSTDTMVRIYKVILVNNTVELNRLSVPQELTSAVRVISCPCNTRAILALRNGSLQEISFSQSVNAVNLETTINTNNDLEDTVHILKISQNGNYLAAADPTGRIVVWVHERNGNNTTQRWKLHCKLPVYHCPATALGIQPGINLLVAVFADHKIIEYNLKMRAFTDFSNKLNTRHPKQWLGRPWPILGVSHDPRARNIIILHDDVAMYIIDKEKELPPPDLKIPRIESSLSDESTSQLKNRDHAFFAVKKYKHLVHFGYIDGDELLAVEVNPLSIIEQLPPCLKTKQFGTM